MTSLEEGDEKGYVLLRRGRTLTYTVCGNAAMGECWHMDYRSLVSCNFL